MIIIIVKFIHYLAIVFSGGVLVGSGVIQSVYTRANQIPDTHVSRILKLLGYFGLISLIISGKNENLTMKFAMTVKTRLPKINGVDILGPVFAPILKLKKSYRARILIRCPKNFFIQKYLSLLLTKIKSVSGIKLEVDVDPINFS